MFRLDSIAHGAQENSSVQLIKTFYIQFTWITVPEPTSRKGEHEVSVPLAFGEEAGLVTMVFVQLMVLAMGYKHTGPWPPDGKSKGRHQITLQGPCRIFW